MGPSPALRAIASLDPVKDHAQIVRLTCRQDFPFDTTRALELALFRAFAVPRVSALLDRTGEFARAPQKRYDDTDIIVSELIEHGYSSPRGLAALRRMNHLHGRFDIANDDFLYVLSTFVFEPIRWIDRFGWRPLIDAERTAMFHFWREVGRRMGIRDLPPDYASFEQFNRDYEARQFVPADTNRRVAEATLGMFCAGFPRPQRPLVRRGMLATRDAPLLHAMGLPRPAAPTRALTTLALRARAHLLRLVPRRKQPLLRTQMRHRTYPAGYEIDRLGPPETQPPP
jgi:hypothetical protein